MTLTANDFRFAPGANDVDKADFNRALLYLSGSPTANEIMQQVANDPNTTIKIVHNNADGFLLSNDEKTIFWDPHSAIAVPSNTEEHATVGIQSAALGLLHEGAHATKDKSTPGKYYSATFLADANGNPIVDPVTVGSPSMSPHRWARCPGAMPALVRAMSWRTFAVRPHDMVAKG